MSRKIVGITVGSPLPKPNLKQTDPTKGDYVKGKDVIPVKVSQLDNDSGYLTEHQDISGKLDANKLPEAINTALAQAKVSGMFDGKDGKDGVDGKDGKDGYTPIKGVDYFDGKDGLNGKDGADGKDGQNGSDYVLTESDKQEIASMVEVQGGGSVDIPCPLPYEYLPDGVPYVGDNVAVEILPECHVSYNANFDANAVECTKSLEVGKTYTVTYNGMEYTCVGIDGSILAPGVVALGNTGDFGIPGNGEPFVIATGFVPGYLVVVPYDGSTTPTVAIKYVGDVVNKLDNRCLDLEWLPVINATPIVAEQTVDTANKIVIGGYGGYAVKFHDGKEMFELLRAYDEITVIYGGKHYRCVVIEDKTEGLLFFGNFSIVQAGNPNTGEPFAFQISQFNAMIIVPVEGTHTFTLAVSEPNKLPTDFLPMDEIKEQVGDYTLTEADKQEIANLIPSGGGGSGETREALVFESAPTTEEVSEIVYSIGDATNEFADKLLNADTMVFYAHLNAPAAESTDATKMGNITAGVNIITLTWAWRPFNAVAASPIPAISYSPSTDLRAVLIFAGEKKDVVSAGAGKIDRFGINISTAYPKNQGEVKKAAEVGGFVIHKRGTNDIRTMELKLTSTTPIGAGSYIRLEVY